MAFQGVNAPSDQGEFMNKQPRRSNQARGSYRTRRNALVLLLLTVVSGLFTTLYLALTGNTAQPFTDIILEYTAIFQTNKLVERNLVYLLIFGGIILYSLYYLLTQCKKDRKEEVDSRQNCTLFRPNIIMIVLGAALLTNYVITAEVPPILLLLFFLMATVGRRSPTAVFVASLFLLYALLAVYRIYANFGGSIVLDTTTLAIAMALMVILVCLISKKELTLKRIALVCQCFVPILLSIFFMNRYLYEEDVILVPIPLQAGMMVGLLMFVFVIGAIRKLKDNWNSSGSFAQIISFGACVSILTFDSFGGTGAIISNDLHHPYENIIAFSQIFELGQTPFAEYIPSSGFYSIIQGFFFEVFGEGEMVNYYLAENTFYFFIAIITIAALWSQADKRLVLLIAVLYVIPDYNRFVFALPVAFLLLLPSLRKNKNRWLQAWAISSLLLGLYYPICGVAVFLGFLPLAILQCYRFIKSGELRQRAHTALFWIGWIACLIILVLAFPLLRGMLGHILAMSGQSLYADSIARFGQMLSASFFPYLQDNLFLSQALFYIFSFAPLALIVWIAYAAALDVAKPQIAQTHLSTASLSGGLSFLFCAVFLIVCYTFTILRSDIGSFFARSSFVMFIAVILIIVLAMRYIKCTQAQNLIVGAAVVIAMLGGNIGLTSVSNQLENEYSVPAGYIHIDNSPIEKLGDGFINEEIYSSLLHEYEAVKELDRSLDYYGVGRGSFSTHYLFGLKGAASLEALMTVKSFDATKETIANLKANDAHIFSSPLSSFGISPVYNYYLYRWILTSGDCVWSEVNHCFIPSETKLSREEAIKCNLSAETNWKRVSLRGEANSLGKSIESLKNILTEADASFSLVQTSEGSIVEFGHPMLGVNADFLYLDLSSATNKREYTLYTHDGKFPQEADKLTGALMQRTYNRDKEVIISWQSGNMDCQMTCWMGNGKLLIPLGADPDWLLKEHSSLKIAIRDIEGKLETPKIDEIEFYQLRDLE